MITEVLSSILSQYLWYKRSIQVDNSYVYFLNFSEKNIAYVSQLFSDNGYFKQWHEFKREHNLHEIFYFQWLQLIDAVHKGGKLISKKTMKILLMLSFMIII